jgi:hypothetical protein
VTPLTPFTAAQVTFAPANEVSADELDLVFGAADAGRCMCQRFKVPGWIWRDSRTRPRDHLG